MDGTWVHYENGAEKLPLATDDPQKIVRRSAEGWVPTLMVETRDYLTELVSQGVQAIDVETKYFAEFFATHAGCETAVLISVSDLPLGQATYGNESITRGIMMKSIHQIAPALLSLFNDKTSRSSLVQTDRTVPDLRQNPSPASDH